MGDLYPLAKQVIILGVRGMSEAYLRRILPFNHPGYNIVGIVDDDPGLAGYKIAGIPVIGNASQILSLTQSRKIDLVVVAMQQRRGCFPTQPLLNCRNKGVRVVDLPQFYEDAWGKLMLEYPRSDWLIFAPGFKDKAKGVGHLFKRILELAVAGMLLAVLLPIGLLAAVCGGGIPTGRLFNKTRCIGQHGVEFNRLSFACPDNRFGRFMRYLKMQDWPMLVNMMLGQISWVGIGCYNSSQRDDLQQYPLFYRRLMEFKPGILNWAGANQVNGRILEFREQLEYDLYYLKHYGWRLNVKAFFKGVFKGLKEFFQFDLGTASNYKEVSYYVEAKH